MIRFGPGGNSESFYAQGYKSTYQAFKWLRDMGLDAYEYQGGKGLFIKEESARQIGEEAGKHGIALSLHAPYFINLANNDDEKMARSFEYVEKSVQVAEWMNAGRIVIHTGSPVGQSREKALERIIAMFGKLMELYGDRVILCPELMGKVNQMGDLGEIIEICNVDERILPVIDFGHLNARTRGMLDSSKAFEDTVEALVRGIGLDRTKRMHVHFSRIEFTDMGEKRHWTEKDTQYGPDFLDFIPVIKKYGLVPVIISESAGTMAEDALWMKEMYNQ
ncbi:MAG: TIM barrel protein [Clostridia bacterium]